MSVRQYIGARYVTKIYENSLNPSSAEWEGSRAYEPLTLVTYLNSSYLSKKEVPASVGDPASNPTYWVITGAYNGQIVSLQNQINAINAALAGNNRKFIVICDSYGNYTNGSGNNFYQQAFADLGITDYYDFHRGSSGFSQSGSLNFLQVLQDNESSIPDKSEITDIIVAGGANDQSNLNDIDQGITDFVNYVKVEYPNAKVHIGHFTNSIENSLIDGLTSSYIYYKDSTIARGAHYIENSQYVMLKLAFFNNDNVHPSADGIAALTKYFTEYLIQGHFDVFETAESCYAAGTNANIRLNSDNLYQRQNNGIITISSYGGGGSVVLEPASQLSIPAGEGTFSEMFTFVNGFAYSRDHSNLNIPCRVGYSSFWCDGLIYLSKPEANKLVKGSFFTYSQNTGTLAAVRLSIGSMSFSTF